MDFVAIDFETATSNYTSVCSLGICVVENNKITDRKEILKMCIRDSANIFVMYGTYCISAGM